MKINISSLSEGEHHYIYIEQPSVFEINSIDFMSNVNLDVNLSKRINQIELKVKLDVKLNLICDRCLDYFPQDVKNEFNLIYKYSFKNDLSLIEETTDENLKLISPDTDYIDITSDVRDYILLAVPMRKVPDEKDGVCIHCKKKINDILNIKKKDSNNPVWDKLQNFKKSS
jgi:uncharacterized metal-binding protein YceD (DUF177 family)